MPEKPDNFFSDMHPPELARLFAQAIIRLFLEKYPPNPLDNQRDKSVYTPEIEKT